MHAHPESNPALVNRYITVAAHEDQVEISVAMLYGHIPARGLRQKLDSSGDKEISIGEIQVEKQRLAAEAPSWLATQHNGQPLTFAATISFDLGGNFSTGQHPLVIEGRLSIRPGPGEHHFELTPGPPANPPGETEIMAALGTGWQLLRSQGPAGPHASVHKLAPDQASSVRFVLVRNNEANTARKAWLPAFAIAAAALMASLWLWRARKTSR